MEKTSLPPPQEDQPPPPMAELTPRVAYLNACQNLGNMAAMRLRADIQAAGGDIGQTLLQHHGSALLRELEVVALVRLLVAKKICTEDEFYTEFLHVAAAMAKAIKEQAAAPQLLVAEARIPRGKVP